jgi:hypothetical protein
MVSLDLTSVELAFIGVSGKRDVPVVKKLVEEERALLAKNPHPPLGNGPGQHFPWQSIWIAEKVGGSVGQGWAKRWLELWQAFGGYSRETDQ